MSTAWPALPLEGWRDTYATLHRFMQVVGKIRLELTPVVNHFWNVAFHFTARGLTSRPTPYAGRTFEMEFDFVSHHLVLRTSDGAVRALKLVSQPVADFYHDVMDNLAALGIEVEIDDRPVEIPTERIPFHLDRLHAKYDPEWAEHAFQILSRSAVIFEVFRARFVGKCSPVHFFWGSFDLACSRFSGRRAPNLPGGDPITRESYSHEVISAGFWPGDARFPEPAYYCYAVPIPDGLAEAHLLPEAAFFHPVLGEFLLPYEAVRTARFPSDLLLQFLQSSYEAGAQLAGWNRRELERPPPPQRPVPAEEPSVSP